jgi:hypothetical protein
MYLFTRTATMAPSHLREALSFSADITTYVNHHTELEVSNHMFLYGRPQGTVAWSCLIEDHTQMARANEALFADDSYLDQTSKAAELFVGPAEDALREVLHVAGEMDGPSAYTSAVISSASADRMADALAWGVEMAELVRRVSGRTCVFLADTYGSFGGVGWLTGFDDPAAIDAMRGSLREDEQYLTAMAASTGLFITGSGRTSLVQRMG